MHAFYMEAFYLWLDKSSHDSINFPNVLLMLIYSLSTGEILYALITILFTHHTFWYSLLG